MTTEVPEIKSNEFQCEFCYGVFEKILTEKEALEQYDEEFHTSEHEEIAGAVCDNCFKIVLWLKGEKIDLPTSCN